MLCFLSATFLQMEQCLLTHYSNYTLLMTWTLSLLGSTGTELFAGSSPQFALNLSWYLGVVLLHTGVCLACLTVNNNSNNNNKKKNNVG